MKRHRPFTDPHGQYFVRLAAILLFLCFSIALPPSAGPAASASAYAQSAAQRSIQESVVVFEVTDLNESGRASNDQITIAFSNRSFNGQTAAPKPLMGDDVVAEFSFSGQDVKSGSLKFTRRVRDLSFLDARYIRILNQGNSGWNGDKLSITVDGTAIIKGVSLLPRSGSATTGEIRSTNPKDWARRVYWEKDFPSLRGYSKGGF